MNDTPVTIAAADVAEQEKLGRTLIALNNANAAALSWLDGDRLRHLVAEAFLARRIGEGDALLLAFDQAADYDSPNFIWFRSRFQRFVYIDRIVVALEARGRGYARSLYRDVFEHACGAGHDRVVCEVNSNPPNPESDAFHAALGFTEVGAGSPHGDSKTVRYLMHHLTP